MDFVSDQLANSQRFRVLNIVDDFSREYVLQVAAGKSPLLLRIIRRLH
jgi:putative transposase